MSGLLHGCLMSTPHTNGPGGTSPRSLGTILSIWAHPDDETYLAGGLMAAARANGQRVVCASASDGEHGTSDPGAWPPARLGAVRRWESLAAMAVLGVVEHHAPGMPDGGLEARARFGLDWVSQLIDEVSPDTILTFGPEGMTSHPDHIAVHHWVTDAWAARGCRSRLLYATTTVEHLERFGELYEEWDMYMSDDRPLGVSESTLAVHLRLDGVELDRKLTALRAMATQTSEVMALVGPDTYAAQVAEEAFIEAAGRSSSTGRTP